MDNLTVKLETAEGNEIVWREGKAPDVVLPKALIISGDIRSVGNFVAHRQIPGSHQSIDGELTIVTADLDNGTIFLQTDPNSIYGTEVKGTLLESYELKPFGINGSKKFSQKELVKLFKQNRNFFPNQEQHADLVLQYIKVEFKTSTSGHATEDYRGNKSKAFDKKVETNLPVFFILKLPIYRGEDSKSFRVEICLEVTDADAIFWLESVELHEIQQIEKEVIFKRELGRCAGLVIINK
jgi:hypothetical protein